MPTYAILRDLSTASTAGPFEAVAAAREDGPSEPRVDVEELSKEDVRQVARDPQVRALAPIMPTRLVEPAEVSDAAASTTAWGVTAVGADTSDRTGTGVDVAILDTGIDAGHPAFAGVTLVQEDFTGSGNGDRKGHGTHCAGTILGRDVDGTRIGVARGVGKPSSARFSATMAQANPTGCSAAFSGRSSRARAWYRYRSSSTSRTSSRSR